MKDKFFLDTNIILYSFDKKDMRKKQIASDLIQKGLVNGLGRLSFQVIQEFINVSTKGKILTLKPEDILLYIQEILIPQCNIRPDIDFIIQSLHLKNHYNYSFYDSMILCAALAQDCSIIYSEDLHSGHKIKGLVIQNPFV